MIDNNQPGIPLPKRNYGFEKRQKELAKAEKRKQKAERRAERGSERDPDEPMDDGGPADLTHPSDGQTVRPSDT